MTCILKVCLLYYVYADSDKRLVVGVFFCGEKCIITIFAIPFCNLLKVFYFLVELQELLYEEQFLNLLDYFGFDGRINF